MSKVLYVIRWRMNCGIILMEQQHGFHFKEANNVDSKAQVKRVMVRTSTLLVQLILEHSICSKVAV
ncbi:hypothetical protein RND71_008594 [Anisodus tanguticus]|uniref:Uncharacterized protein n=1 Tax=Anisodus tanguticus TaxID=243964 RepID=A0AAE1VUD7_9SOLA|nr:hypothetical protein RND71_008594 [Anisodus tanguticus]